MTATLPRMTEREFMEQVTQLAELRGWSWAHFRPAQTAKGWRTPVSGPLGKGWPDLVLIRKRRIVFAELKSEGGRMTTEQAWVMDLLLGVEHYDSAFHNKGLDCNEVPDVRVEFWRPSDSDLIEATLR